MIRKVLLLLGAVGAFCLFAQAQNNSLDFDGTDDMVNAGTINLSGTALTIETWVKVDQFQAAFPNITSVGGIEEPVGGATNTAMIRIGDAGVPNNQVQFVLQFGGSQVKSNSNTLLAANTWTHIAATYDGANMRIYINGVLDDTQAQTGAFTANGDFMMGAQYDGRFLDGHLDDFRIWSVTRTGTEIANNFNTELNGTEAGLVAYYKFDNSASPDDVEDCSPNNNHGDRDGTGGANNLPQFDSDVPTITDVACGLVNTCAITSITIANVSACNDGGTDDNAFDDTFTADVTVNFVDPPASGNLNLSGDGSASIAVGSLAGTSHTFNSVSMPADGGSIFLTASFSADAGCTATDNVGTAPAHCSPNAPVSSIPTMSEWGLILFALIMFTLTVVFGTQTQRAMALSNSTQMNSTTRQRLPFNRAIYFSVLPIVYLTITLVFAIAILVFGYELTSADVPGSIFAGAIIAYLVHFVKASGTEE